LDYGTIRKGNESIFYLTDALCNYLTIKSEILQPINREGNPMRNLKEDKDWLESVFGHYGQPLDFSEVDIIARHAIDRAIDAEKKLEIAVKALGRINNCIGYMPAHAPMAISKLAIEQIGEISVVKTDQ
jgi:hypothetical protein